MRILGRIIVIFFAVLLASVSAGIAIAVGIYGPQWHSVSGDVGERFFFWVTAFFASAFAGRLVMLPTTVLIVIAEIFKIRSLLANVAAGAAMMALVFYSVTFSRPSYEESIDRPQPGVSRDVPISHDIEIAAAAGAVFGLAYWLIAGRNAGRWREA
jgi:hypothetical protein